MPAGNHWTRSNPDLRWPERDSPASSGSGHNAELDKVFYCLLLSDSTFDDISERDRHYLQGRH